MFCCCGSGFYFIVMNLNRSNKTDTQFVTGKCLSMSGTTWVHESTFSTANVKSEYRSSTSDDKVASKRNVLEVSMPHQILKTWHENKRQNVIKLIVYIIAFML